MGLLVASSEDRSAPSPLLLSRAPLFQFSTTPDGHENKLAGEERNSGVNRPHIHGTVNVQPVENAALIVFLAMARRGVNTPCPLPASHKGRREESVRKRVPACQPAQFHSGNSPRPGILMPNFFMDPSESPSAGYNFSAPRQRIGEIG